MCDNYYPDEKCENEDNCKLFSLIKENEKLKLKYAKLKKKYDTLSFEMSWIKSPECMGR